MSAAVASECNPRSFAFGAEGLKLPEGRRRGLAIGRRQAHAGERIDVRHLAGMAAEDDVPRAPTGLHRMIDGRAPLALDHVAACGDLPDDQQLLIERVGDGGGDRRQRRLPEAPPVLQFILPNQLKPRFMDASCPRI
jgi:hypothetical protein